MTKDHIDGGPNVNQSEKPFTVTLGRDDVTLDVHTKETVIATCGPADPKDVDYVCRNKRSVWLWVTLANGDLLLATYPYGETYEAVRQRAALACSIPSPVAEAWKATPLNVQRRVQGALKCEVVRDSVIDSAIGYVAAARDFGVLAPMPAEFWISLLQEDCDRAFGTRPSADVEFVLKQEVQ
jgi:hypothetical protein